MKIPVLDLEGKESKRKDLPKIFDEAYRPDLLKRAVIAIQSNKRQPYGAKPGAGMRASGFVSKRRRDFRGCYGHGMSRVPRKSLGRSGVRFNWVAAIAPGTVGGRQAHPPKAEKIWAQKLNIKERRKAIRSGIAATVNKAIVASRGHKLPNSYPFIIDNSIENMDKTKAVRAALIKLGLTDELNRCDTNKIRAGKGKARGRKRIKKVGPLIVVSQNCRLNRSAINIPGVDVVQVKSINAELLAPGTVPARLTIWTEGAIEKLDKERLFY